MPDDDLRDAMNERFTSECDAVASGLEALAKIVRTGGRNITHLPNPDRGSATSIAADLVHHVMWGLANAGVDRIVSAAAEFDRVTAKVPSTQDSRPGIVTMSWLTAALHTANIPLADLAAAGLANHLTGDGELNAAAFTGHVTGDVAALLNRYEHTDDSNNDGSRRRVLSREWHET